MSMLQRRVEELEDALRRKSDTSPNLTKLKHVSMPHAPENYTFPSAVPLRRPEPLRRDSSPTWRSERDAENHSVHGSENGSPAPFYGRRLSVSAIRLDRSQPLEPLPQRLPVNVSPPHSHREAPSHPTLPSINPHNKGTALTSSSAVLAPRASLLSADGQNLRKHHLRRASPYHHPHPSDSHHEHRVSSPKPAPLSRRGSIAISPPVSRPGSTVNADG